MKTTAKLGFVLATLFTLFTVTGCTQPIPPGYVGKIVSTSGVEPEIYAPGRVTVMPRQRLILIETASEMRAAPVKVIMSDRIATADGEVDSRIGLDMDFIVNIRYRLRSDDRIITAMLNDMRLDSSVSSIGVRQIYEKYGNMVIGRVAREVLGRYSPEEVLDNLPAINAELDSRAKEGLKDSPLLVSEVSLGPITLPPVITERIRLNKDTELSEAQARTEQRIRLLEKQNEIELARQQALREMVDARSLAQQNRELNASITPEVLRLRELQIEERRIEMQREVMRAGLERGNNAIFIPYGALDNPGAQMRMFQK